MSKTFTLKDVSVSIKTVVLKKMQHVMIYIQSDTKEHELMYSIGCKYKSEKVVKMGTNKDNNLYGIIVGTNGIILECPENKIVNNIIQFLNYVGKCKLKKEQFYGKVGSFKTLNKDLNKLNITIVGKCKTFTKNCIEPKDQAPKITKMLESIANRTITDTPNIENPDFTPCECYEFKSELPDVAILMNDFNVQFKKTSGGMSVCCVCPSIKCQLTTYADVLKNNLKAFKNQCGSFGSDDAKNQEYFKQINVLVEMISDVRGCKVSFKSADECKKSGAEAIKEIKKVFKC